MKKVFHLLCFTIIFVILFCFANVLFLPARTQEIAVDSYHWEHTGLQLLEDNTVDVIYLGSSHMFSSISPEDIFMDYGITGYILSSSCQKVWQSYFYLMEAMETQKPKVVMLDTFMALDGGPQSEAFNREAIENMKFSKAKIESVKMAVSMNEEGEFELGYWFPLLRYHDRWSELEEKDFKYFTTENRSPCKGFLPRIGVVEAAFNYESYETGYASEMNALCREYLDKIKELCETNGCQLILVKIPTCLWNGDNASTVASYAEENNLVYLDYNADENLRKQVNIDWSVDSLDGGNHLNYDGAMKMTDVVGAYLDEHFEFQDKRGASDYELWQDDYKYYKQCVNNYQLAKSNYFTEWIKYLNDDYNVVFCNLGMQQDLLSAEDAQAIEDRDILKNAYGISVYDDLVLKLSREWDGDAEFTHKELGKSCNISFQLGDTSVHLTCSFNHESFEASQQGIVGIVFDKITGEQVDAGLFIKNEEGSLVRQQ